MTERDEKSLVSGVREDELARRLGVSRVVVKEYRRGMVMGEDWGMVGRVVYWRGKGLRLLAERVPAVRGGIEEVIREVEGVGDGEGGGGGVDVGYEVKVLRADYPNRRVIECIGEGIGKVLVRVRSADNFVRGMKCVVKRDGRGWVLEGRCPRWRGRW